MAATARRLREALLHFEGVSDLHGPLPSVHLDRISARFQAIHAQARLFLLGRHQSTTGGAQEGQAVLFRMNDLFEAWIARTIRRNLAPDGWTVSAQGPQRNALSRDGVGVFFMKPDLVLDRPGLRIVVDTKWKRLAPLSAGPKRDVSQGDVYQLMAYAHVYGADAVLLVYPSQTGSMMIDRLRIGTHGIPFWLAEVTLGDLRIVSKELTTIVREVVAVLVS